MLTVGAYVAMWGALGALGVLCLMILGGVAGWHLHRLYCREERRALASLPTASPPTAGPPTASPPRTETERDRRAREDREAVDRLLHYSPDDAYGTGGGETWPESG